MVLSTLILTAYVIDQFASAGATATLYVAIAVLALGWFNVIYGLALVQGFSGFKAFGRKQWVYSSAISEALGILLLGILLGQSAQEPNFQPDEKYWGFVGGLIVAIIFSVGFGVRMWKRQARSEEVLKNLQFAFDEAVLAVE